MRAGVRPAGSPVREAAGFRYDTDLIKSEAERLLVAYLGQPGKASGSRLVWDCPKCGKPKLSLFRTKGSVGCLNAGCEVDDSTDVIGVIASLEGLTTRGEGFKQVCSLSYRLLSIPDPKSPSSPPENPAPADADGRAASPNGSSSGGAGPGSQAPPRTVAGAPPPEPFVPAPPEVVDSVLSRLLQLCPLEERDVEFLSSRGVAEATARLGGFGSITALRAAHALGVLDREFPREQLCGVPGFRERGTELGFTLWGDFLLIPYFDRTGRLVTLEGRAVGDVPAWAGKYTSLRNGGNHLYVFPAFEVDDLVAICEGPMGAIVAAQEGLAVGAIQGVKRYTKAGTAQGEEGPLPELARADFGGRTVLYVPDLDVKPDARADVERHAPRACEFLISRQNGRPLIATVPQAAARHGTQEGVKDLDAWILAAPEAGPYGILHTLRSRAHPPEAWPGLPDPDGEDDDTVPVPDAGPPAPEQGPAEDAPQPSGSPAPPDPSPDPSPERAASETPEGLGPETPDDATDEGTGDESANAAGDEEAGGEEAGEQGNADLDAYDRWYALVEGYPGAAGLAARPQPHRPRDAASPVPDGVFAEEAELQWAGLIGLVAALVYWYYVGATDGWLAGGVGFLPSLPGPLDALYGIPFALLFGALVGTLLLLHLRARRLAARRHLLGTDRH